MALLNGVKLRAVLEYIYIECLLERLKVKQSVVGCDNGRTHAGPFGYADDVELQAPNLGYFKGVIKI